MDLERLDVRPLVRDQRRCVVRIAFRQRDQAMVLNSDDLHRIEVHDCYDAFDGPRIGVVVLAGAHPGEGSRQPQGVILGEAKIAVRPAVDCDQRHVADAAPGECRTERRVLLDRLDRLLQFRDRHSWLNAGDVGATNDGIPRQGNDRLEHVATRPVQQRDEGLSLWQVAVR